VTDPPNGKPRYGHADMEHLPFTACRRRKSWTLIVICGDVPGSVGMRDDHTGRAQPSRAVPRIRKACGRTSSEAQLIWAHDLTGVTGTDVHRLL
jgi:hypothetical protein